MNHSWFHNHYISIKVFVKILFLSICFSGNVSGQQGALLSSLSNLRFDHLSFSNGLSFNVVNSILKDKQGFIWISTQDGLNRYDGVNFKIYRRECAREAIAGKRLHQQLGRGGCPRVVDDANCQGAGTRVARRTELQARNQLGGPQRVADQREKTAARGIKAGAPRITIAQPVGIVACPVVQFEDVLRTFAPAMTTTPVLR